MDKSVIFVLTRKFIIEYLKIYAIRQDGTEI